MKRPQSILIFIHSLSCGGAERVAANLANHWAGKGWRVTVVTLAAQSEDFYQLHPAVKRVALNLSGASHNPLTALINNLRRIFALRRVLRRVRPDVALGMMVSSNVQLTLAATGLRGLVTIGSEHIHPPQLPLSRLWEGLRRFCYGNLEAVTALTTESRDWLLHHTKVKKVAVIPNAVPWPLPTQAPWLIPQAVLPPGQKLLLAVGRLCEQKGFDLLIDAFGQIAAEHADWYLVILGEGPLRDNLAAQIASTGLEGRVLLPGRVGNVSDWYAAADLYVMSSRFEGFGNTLAEAMAHGVPAVSFDCDTGPRDIIRHEVDGLLVPPGDVAALCAAWRRLMGDDVLRRQFAARAIEARERFSMEWIIGMWETLFEELQHGK